MKNVISLILVFVLATVGMASPFGTSSMAVSLMILFIPFILILAIMRRVNSVIKAYLRYNFILVSFFAFYSFYAFVHGGMAYPSYFISILIHQVFFICCLISIKIENIQKIFIYTAFLNFIFFLFQAVGGMLDIDDLARLAYFGIMKGPNLEYIGNIPRASGLMSEPVHLSYILLPPILYTILAKIHSKGRFYQKFIFGGTYLLTLSFVAYVQFAIALSIIFARKIKFKNFVGLIIVVLVLASIYSQVSFGRDRIDGVISVFSGENTNQSSVFAIQSNLMVAADSIQNNPIFGHGLTSHRRNFENLIESLFDFQIDETWLDMNKDDAASLYILLASETGLLGCTAFLYLLFILISKFSKSNSLISIIGLSHSITLLVVGLRYGQIASIHVMLNLQIALFCFASLRFDNYQYLINSGHTKA